MAAPAVTVRLAPTGIRLTNGLKCVKGFAVNPSLSIWEIETGTPGMDNGDPINTSTQWNTAWQTMRSRQLNTLTEHTVKFAYDPVVRSGIENLMGHEGAVTDLFPDGTTYSYYAYIRKIDFDPLKDGDMPTGTMTVQPTNTDPATHTEEPPVLVNVAGT